MGFGDFLNGLQKQTERYARNVERKIDDTNRSYEKAKKKGYHNQDWENHYSKLKNTINDFEND